MTKFGTRPLNIASDTMQDVWLELLDHLVTNYDHTPAPRGMATREITGVVLRINDLRNNILYNPVRNLNYRFMVAEFLWIAFGRDDIATITQYNAQLERFSDDGKKMTGAYGPRLATQWRYIIKSLQRDPVSRQAVSVIWTPSPGPSKDIPCTLIFQFIVREGKLDMIVTMRSSDIWLGLPYDVYSFSQLGNALAGIMSLKPGYIQMQLGSSHLYETNLEKARAILAAEAADIKNQGLRSPSLPTWPPAILESVLINPTAVYSFDEPWDSYARILQVRPWSEARELLSRMV